MFSKLKTILSAIDLLLTLDREYRKVFEMAPKTEFRRAKCLKEILARAKAVADNLKVLGAKYANMLRLLKHLDLLVPKENIALTPII